MNFVADESVDAPIYKALLNAGHTVFAIVENNPGIDDEQVLLTAYQRQAILITQDKDFGELVYRLGKSHYGVILLRLSGMKPFDKASLTLSAITQHSEDLPEAFTVIFPDYLKIRKKPVS